MADRSKTPDLFTPLFECVVKKYGIIGAGVFGEVRLDKWDRMWYHVCNGERQKPGPVTGVMSERTDRLFVADPVAFA